MGDFKLLVGGWGSDTWCDLNTTGLSPEAPAAPPNKNFGPGGAGGLVCVHLNGSAHPGSDAAIAAMAASVTGADGAAGAGPWWNVTMGLFNVAEDPREMHDLQVRSPKHSNSRRCVESWLIARNAINLTSLPYRPG